MVDALDALNRAFAVPYLSFPVRRLPLPFPYPQSLAQPFGTELLLVSLVCTFGFRSSRAEIARHMQHVLCSSRSTSLHIAYRALSIAGAL